jgi:hypothetical protein
VNEQPDKKVKGKDEEARFYLLFDEVARLSENGDVSPAEIEEIERVARMVQDVADEEQPLFITST